MDYQEAIEIFENEIKKLNTRPIHVNHIGDAEKAENAMKTAISAMQELQELKVSDDNLNDHIQELKQAKYDIETFWEEPTALSRAMQRAINALIEVKLYKQFGTLEEVREAVEKQTAKEPRATNRCYVCPHCGLVTSLRAKRNYCDACGQKILWKVEEWGKKSYQ